MIRLVRGTLAVLLACAAAASACGGPDRDVMAVPPPTVADAAPPEAESVAVTPVPPTVEADAGGEPVAPLAPPPPSDFDAGPFIASPANADVFITLNQASMRKHPVAKRAGPLLAQLPVFSALAASSIDLVRDVDWTMTWGSSVVRIDHGIFVTQPNVDDATTDRAIEGAAKKHPNGGLFDAGVPGVDATLGSTGSSERAFLRPQSKLLVIAHRTHAAAAASELKSRRPKDPNPKETIRVVIKRPSTKLSLSRVKLDDVSELRATLVLKDADGSGDVRVEADYADAKKAAAAVAELNDALKNANSIAVRIVTRGLLNNAAFGTDGNRAVLKLAVPQEQLEGILQVLAGSLGVTLSP